MENNDISGMDLEEVSRMAQSEAGQKLVELFRHRESTEYQDAMDAAARGDYSKAAQMIRAFLSDPEAAALAKQLQEE